MTTEADLAQPSRESESALEIRDLCYAYDPSHPVVSGISLEIRAGEAVGIVGPSGCGKSTLLSLISGLLTADSGEVSSNLSKGSSYRHPVAMVFQKDTLLPWLTVEHNIRFFTKLRCHGLKSSLLRRITRTGKLGNQELDQRVALLLELGGLTRAAELYPYQLSGGMRRRLAFLVAMAPNPQVLMLDEPFSSVDEPTRVGIHQDVFAMTRAMGTTTLLVTHDLAEAVSLCDRVLVLSARPARIVDDFAIPFGNHRQMLELRESSTYAEVYQSLWHSLSRQIRLQNDQTEREGHEDA